MDVEVDGLVLDETADSQASQTSTNSASSLAIQFSVEDLQENNAELLPPRSTDTVRNEGKARRLNRRMALANLQLPKLTPKQNCVIDLCTDEDRQQDLEWLKKKFPSINTNVAKSTLKPQSNPSKNRPSSIASQRTLKQVLEKKLAERRRIGLAKRKELYLEDNEGLLDEEEEEETDAKKSIKPKKHLEEPLGSDEDSEEDEDYNGDDEGEENVESESEASGSDDGEGEKDEQEEILDKKTNSTGEDLPESVDLFDGASTVGSVVRVSQSLKEDDMRKVAQAPTQGGTVSGGKLHPVDSLNLMLDKDFDTESTPGMTQPVFPNSLSQWFGDKQLEEGSSQEVPASVQTPEFVNIGSFSDMDPFKDAREDDMLMLCSGRFDTQSLSLPVEASLQEDQNSNGSYDEESVHQGTSTQKRKRKLIESDDEADTSPDLPEAVDVVPEEKQSATELAEEGSSTEEPKVLDGLTHFRRTIVDSDSDDSIEEEEQVSVFKEKEQEEEDKEGVDYSEEELPEEREGKDYIEEEADDSDDELAVIRRLQKSEFERKANREKWFDDEASLSGDDVGSDLDEDGDVANEYEAEEGDADDVPDSDAIRRQNHRLLLKQEKDREHLELIKLQDRLLADGDLGGTETNRTFRLKLREDVNAMDGEEGETEAAEEDEGETSSQAHAQRVSAIKWLMEHEEEYQKICNEKDEDDIFDIAARSVQISSEVTVNVVSKAPRTLLGQAGLENAIKEVAGATCAKQLYVSNTAQKRPSSPTFQPAKKSRSIVSVLSVLEQQ